MTFMFISSDRNKVSMAGRIIRTFYSQVIWVSRKIVDIFEELHLYQINIYMIGKESVS